MTLADFAVENFKAQARAELRADMWESIARGALVPNEPYEAPSLWQRAQAVAYDIAAWLSPFMWRLA